VSGKLGGPAPLSSSSLSLAVPQGTKTTGSATPTPTPTPQALTTTMETKTPATGTTAKAALSEEKEKGVYDFFSSISFFLFYAIPGFHFAFFPSLFSVLCYLWFPFCFLFSVYFVYFSACWFCLLWVASWLAVSIVINWELHSFVLLGLNPNPTKSSCWSRGRKA
jgi:hypothetical protein